MSLENIVYLFGLCFHGDNNYPKSSIEEFGVYNYITYGKEFEPMMCLQYDCTSNLLTFNRIL